MVTVLIGMAIMATNRDYSKIIAALKAKALAEGVTPEEKKSLEDKITELENKYEKEPIVEYPFVIADSYSTPSWVTGSSEFKYLFNTMYGKNVNVDTSDIIEEEYQEQRENEPW